MNNISQGKSPVYYELRAELDIFFMNYNFHFKKITTQIVGIWKKFSPK